VRGANLWGLPLSIEINPRRLQRGPWNDGYALDVHTRGSTFLGYNQYGYPSFDTTRSPVGELLYQLKYRNDQKTVPHLVDAVDTFWETWRPAIDAIVPVPPSVARKDQPVMLIAAALSDRLKIPLCTSCLAKVKQTPQLKDIVEYDKRTEALKDAFVVASGQTKDKTLLLFDDLFGSGATVRAIVGSLKNEGQAKAVYLLTLTTK
jgi:competence protein ComFC